VNNPLALALGSAFAAIGAGAIIAPKTSAGQYGLPTEDPSALAFVRALGARDIAIGGALISNRDDRPALARICFWSTIAALADAAAVGSVRGLRLQHVVHISGALALILAGNAFRTTPPLPPETKGPSAREAIEGKS
jgi:hypothetical protein